MHGIPFPRKGIRCSSSSASSSPLRSSSHTCTTPPSKNTQGEGPLTLSCTTYSSKYTRGSSHLTHVGQPCTNLSPSKCTQGEGPSPLSRTPGEDQERTRRGGGRETCFELPPCLPPSHVQVWGQGPGSEISQPPVPASALGAAGEGRVMRPGRPAPLLLPILSRSRLSGYGLPEGEPPCPLSLDSPLCPLLPYSTLYPLFLYSNNCSKRLRLLHLSTFVRLLPALVLGHRYTSTVGSFLGRCQAMGCNSVQIPCSSWRPSTR